MVPPKSSIPPDPSPRMTGLRAQVNAWMTRSSKIEADLIRDQATLNAQKATLATKEARIQAWENNKIKFETDLAKAKQDAAQCNERKDKILAGQKTLLDTALQTERLIRVNRDALQAENELLKQTCEALQTENTHLKKELGRLETETDELKNQRYALQIGTEDLLMMDDSTHPVDLLEIDNNWECLPPIKAEPELEEEQS